MTESDPIYSVLTGKNNCSGGQVPMWTIFMGGGHDYNYCIAMAEDGGAPDPAAYCNQCATP